jgi:hypothetical protein
VDLSQLPLSFPLFSRELVAYYNQIANIQDIALVPVEVVRFLPDVTAGQKMVAYASWAEAEQELDSLPSPIDIVAYNPEHWDKTPFHEQQNLPAVVQQAASFAHARGLLFMYAPDRRFAKETLSQVAPFVDLITLQGQLLQHDPQEFAEWMEARIQSARASNPNVKIFAQVGATRGPAPEMHAALLTIADKIDGISVWVGYDDESRNILEQLVTLIRG